MMLHHTNNNASGFIQLHAHNYQLRFGSLWFSQISITKAVSDKRHHKPLGHDENFVLNLLLQQEFPKFIIIYYDIRNNK